TRSAPAADRSADAQQSRGCVVDYSRVRLHPRFSGARGGVEAVGNLIGRCGEAVDGRVQDVLSGMGGEYGLAESEFDDGLCKPVVYGSALKRQATWRLTLNKAVEGSSGLSSRIRYRGSRNSWCEHSCSQRRHSCRRSSCEKCRLGTLKPSLVIPGRH